MLSLYEILKASKTGIAPDMWTALAGMNWGGADSGHEVKELTGIPPLTFRADGTPLLDYLISGNEEHTGTASPDNPIMPNGTGDMTGNLWDKGDVTITLHERYKSIPISLEQGVYTLSFEYKSENTGTVTVIFYNGTEIIQSFNVTITNDKGIVSITSAQPITNIRLYSTSGYTPSYDYAAEYTNIMLNVGSIALPYEPYGVKIPISSGGNNLFDGEVNEGYYNDSGVLVVDSSHVSHSNLIKSNYNTLYTIDGLWINIQANFSVCEWDKNKQFIRRSNRQVPRQRTMTFSIGSDAVYFSIQIYTEYGYSNIMLNLGATALPYEPYNRTTTPVYLGEVQTTRRIRKLVLTGNEAFTKNDADSTHYFYYGGRGGLLPNSIEKTPLMCNELPVISVAPQTQVGISSNNNFNVVYLNFGADVMNAQPSGNTVAGLKEYLAAQYAAGTPVTIWYVLATPETGIVNEPLRKISDYADTVSMEQAGVQIPTLHGNTVIDVLTDVKPSEVYIKYQE